MYQIPTEDDVTDTVPLALQRVFYNLQTSEQSVGQWREPKIYHLLAADSNILPQVRLNLQSRLDGKVSILSCSTMYKNSIEFYARSSN